MTLLMDARTRAELRRSDPWEVRGAYQWVKAVKGLRDFSLIVAAQASSFASGPLLRRVMACRNPGHGTSNDRRYCRHHKPPSSWDRPEGQTGGCASEADRLH